MDSCGKRKEVPRSGEIRGAWGHRMRSPGTLEGKGTPEAAVYNQVDTSWHREAQGSIQRQKSQGNHLPWDSVLRLPSIPEGSPVGASTCRFKSSTLLAKEHASQPWSISRMPNKGILQSTGDESLNQGIWSPQQGFLPFLTCAHFNKGKEWRWKPGTWAALETLNSAEPCVGQWGQWPLRAPGKHRGRGNQDFLA